MTRFLVVAAAIIALGSAAFAQDAVGPCPGPGRGGGFGGGGGPGWRAGRMFDPATVTTTSGKVEAVEARGGRGQAVFVQVRSSAGALVDVRVGPAWFLQQQKLTLQKGDDVEVTGSRVEYSNGEFMVAQHIAKGDTHVALRDENGVPMWAGWRRR